MTAHHTQYIDLIRMLIHHLRHGFSIDSTHHIWLQTGLTICFIIVIAVFHRRSCEILPGCVQWTEGCAERVVFRWEWGTHQHTSCPGAGCRRGTTITANTKRSTNAGFMLSQRRRRWTNITPALAQRMLFTIWKKYTVPREERVGADDTPPPPESHQGSHFEVLPLGDFIGEPPLLRIITGTTELIKKCVLTNSKIRWLQVSKRSPSLKTRLPLTRLKYRLTTGPSLLFTVFFYFYYMPCNNYCIEYLINEKKQKVYRFEKKYTSGSTEKREHGYSGYWSDVIRKIVEWLLHKNCEIPCIRFRDPQLQMGDN